MSEALDLTELEYRPLSDQCPRGAFSCGDPDIDEWFLKRSKGNHDGLKCRVTTVHIGAAPEVVAFYSLKIALEDERMLEKTNPMRFWAQNRIYPALHLEWLAVDKGHQKRQIGTAVMGRVLETFRDAVLETGIPVLTLVPINDEVQAFYAKLGFYAYAAHQKRRDMMLPGQSVLDMYEKAVTGQP